MEDFDYFGVMKDGAQMFKKLVPKWEWINDIIFIFSSS